MSAPSAPLRRSPMSTRLALILAAAGLGPGLVLYWVDGPEAVPVLIAGIVMGLAGTMVGSARRAAGGGVLILALLAVHTIWPALDPRLAAVAFAVAAGWETARTGGRAMPIALVCGVLIWAAPHVGLPPMKIAVVFLAGLLGGLALAHSLRLERGPKLPPEGDGAGWRHALFLTIGLLLSITLVRNLPTAHGIWIVQMFIMRAMAPPHLTVPQSLRFVLGVLVGVALALGLETHVTLSPQAMHLIGAVAMVLGLKLLPLGPPWPVIPITLAVLLTLAPAPSEALFRSEAALAAAGLAICLSLLLDWLFRDTAPRCSP